jgi:two-component system, OmpR family, sensor kinase
MPEQAVPRSFALMCDAGNRVLSVPHNPTGLPIIPGEPLVELFEPGSRDKALRLLQSIRERRAAYGWELLVSTRGEIMLLQFCGASVAKGILIVAAESQPDANALFGRLLQDTDFDPPVTEAHSTHDTLGLYEQLTSLNNQFLAIQREVEKKNAELARLLEDRARIAAMAAHDLRTPLQVITNATEALAAMLGERPACGNVIDMIRRNVRAMEALTKDLLSAYRADIGMLELSMEPLDFEALVRANAQSNRAVAAQKNITLTFSSSGDVPGVLGDRLRLDQVLNNLVHNAIKFSPPGATVGVGVSGTQSEAAFSVEDQGVGLSTEQLDALLRGTAGASQPGTQAEAGFGLGFGIVRSIVERHRGTIEGQSLPGKGTKFCVRLPADRGARGGIADQIRES